MDADSYGRLRDRCVDEYPRWLEVAQLVEDRLRTALREAGVEVEVSSRAKDVDSLLRKMVFKYRSDDLAHATDRAGARVVVHLPASVDAVRALIRELFEVQSEEETAERYEADQFNYRGVHFDVLVDDLPFDGGALVGPVLCEIQVRTVAEHAWSVLSHLVTYKAPGEGSIPKAMRRRVNRLIALVELFDQEAKAAYMEITERPEYKMQRLVYDVERLHNALVGDVIPTLVRCDVDIVAVFADSYGEAEPAEMLERFAQGNADKIRRLVETYDSHVSPLLRQPEALVLWERLESDVVTAAASWAASGYSDALLAPMATVWGVDLPE